MDGSANKWSRSSVGEAVWVSDEDEAWIPATLTGCTSEGNLEVTHCTQSLRGGQVHTVQAGTVEIVKLTRVFSVKGFQLRMLNLKLVQWDAQKKAKV